MKGLIGFIVAIFLISLTAGLIYYHRNATKREPTNKVPDTTIIFKPDSTVFLKNNLDIKKKCYYICNVT